MVVQVDKVDKMSKGHCCTFGPEFSSDDAGDGPNGKKRQKHKGQGRHQPGQKEEGAQAHATPSPTTEEANNYHDKNSHLPQFSPSNRVLTVSQLIMQGGEMYHPDHRLQVLAAKDYPDRLMAAGLGLGLGFFL